MTPGDVPPLARGPVFGATLAAGVLLTVFSAGYGYHRDELYFRMLPAAWGYVDQPPLTPLLAHWFSDVFTDATMGDPHPRDAGHDDIGARRGAVDPRVRRGTGCAGAGRVGLRVRRHPDDHGSCAADLDHRSAGLARGAAVHRSRRAPRAAAVVAGRGPARRTEPVQQAARRSSARGAAGGRADGRSAAHAALALGVRRRRRRARGRRAEPDLPGDATAGPSSRWDERWPTTTAATCTC